MKKILFIDNPEYLKSEDVIWFDVPPNKGKEDLISSIEQGLDFLVGGTNWDSLDENLATGEWAKKNKIVINHNLVPELTEKDLNIYLSILNDNSAIYDYNNKDILFSELNIGDLLKSDLKWALIVIFPEKFKEKISDIIQRLGQPPFTD